MPRPNRTVAFVELERHILSRTLPLPGQKLAAWACERRLEVATSHTLRQRGVPLMQYVAVRDYVRELGRAFRHYSGARLLREFEALFLKYEAAGIDREMLQSLVCISDEALKRR